MCYIELIDKIFTPIFTLQPNTELIHEIFTPIFTLQPNTPLEVEKTNEYKILPCYLLEKLHQLFRKWNNLTNMTDKDRDQIQNLNLKKHLKNNMNSLIRPNV